MINRTVLVGRLTRDPELRYTQGSTAVASFTLAVNRQFTNSKGEREADFINCVIWKKAAENFTNFTHKGSLVGIDGRIQTRNYENKQGQRVYVKEVVVDNFSLLESRKDNSNDNTNDNSNKAPSYNNNNNQSSQSPFGNNNNNNYGNNAGNGNFDNSNNNSNNNNQSNNSKNNNGDPFANNSKPVDISDDDLPF